MSANRINYVRHSVLWFLMDFGQATTTEIADASGLVLDVITHKVAELVSEGLIKRDGRLIALTPAGIDCALCVDESQVQFAVH